MNIFRFALLSRIMLSSKSFPICLALTHWMSTLFTPSLLTFTELIICPSTGQSCCIEGIENKVGKSEIGFRCVLFVLLLFVRPGSALLLFVFKVSSYTAKTYPESNKEGLEVNRNQTLHLVPTGLSDNISCYKRHSWNYQYHIKLIIGVNKGWVDV